MMKHFSVKIPFFLLFLLYSSCRSLNTISTNQPLKDGDVLLSKGAIFALGFFSPNNNSKNRYLGIWYNNVPKQTVVWVANRGNPLNDTSGVFSINIHGNLVLNHTNRNLNPIWSTHVSVSSSPLDSFAKLLDTGNLVLRDRGGRQKVLWQSFDYPCDTLLPFAKLGLDRKAGLDRILTSWKSPDNPSLGSVTMRIDPTGYPQAFMYKNGVPFWRVGSWAGQRWSGIVVMKPDPVLYVVFINNANEVTVMNGVKMLEDPSIFIRIMLEETGRITRTIWLAQENRWLEVWYDPTEECDRFRKCGSNSICDPYNSKKFQCLCLPGFDKNLRNGSASGCVRKKNVSTCRSGEGFVKVASLKVPETSKALVDNNVNMSLNGCKEKCLKDCSCKAYTSVNEITQRGCLTWHNDMEDIRKFNGGGQDLYVRVDAVELAKYERKPYGSLGKKGLVTIIVLSTLLFILVTTSFLYWFAKKRRHAAKGTHTNYVLDRERNSNLLLFNLSDIIEATNNFSVANMIGKGGFGFVYKGILRDGMEIAVKKLSKYSDQSIEEFKNEVAIMTKLQHKNLVRILGCCIQGEDNMLIYEYLPNKSLDSFIFDQAKKLQLDWRMRFDIICGIARGILYLHQDSRLKIIHRDLKASNILLDHALNPKITDFGMARIFGEDQIEASTNRVVGTYGYMSPEYAMEGLFSIKSDVYGFGVLLLEIIASRKNGGHYDDITSTLVKHIWDLWRENRAMEIIDPSLKYETCLEYDDEVLKCIQIGLLCVQEYASDRPTMLEVVSMLENDSTLPPPKQPAFVFKETTRDHSNQSIGEEANNSLCGMSTSVIEAR
ncbi:G-type lectin S-receptor-like serine/threonine-protein kinase At1g11410 [Neltuma alba]|uniref:G-type lectin S-receptor-like serine/threonine-protein kinase At1g11410 n=1 Tax=Neltuma alba TaxID=207710 RepID=UPI0010A4258A|nr:G-type lectin S-receptor-like serine/threonine-protein kinase At1g11410 [Prosopis alba]